MPRSGNGNQPGTTSPVGVKIFYVPEGTMEKQSWLWETLALTPALTPGRG